MVTAKSKAPVYRVDITEQTLRARALETAVLFGTLQRYDDYNRGYMQALTDLKVEKEYREIFKRVVKRVRISYKSNREFYNSSVKEGDNDV